MMCVNIDSFNWVNKFLNSNEVLLKRIFWQFLTFPLLLGLKMNRYWLTGCGNFQLIMNVVFTKINGWCFLLYMVREMEIIEGWDRHGGIDGQGG